MRCIAFNFSFQIQLAPLHPGKKFTADKQSAKCVDWQKVRLQAGAYPRSR
jgi:hypothetical protein